MSAIETDLPTAGEFRKRVLFESMDARACNVQQDRLVYNPSPECDSLVEHLARIRPYLPAAEYSALLTLIRELLHSNAAEGRHEMSVAAFADQMATFMRQQECNGHRESRA